MMRPCRLPDKATLALEPLVQYYAEHMRVRRLNAKSVQGAAAALHRFCAFMAVRGRSRITEITAPDLEAYQSHLLDLEAATQKNYLIHLRQFFRWLEATGQIFENPAARLVVPHPRRKLVQAPSESQVALLLETPDISTPSGLRDRAWLELAYATGARRIEMFRLTVQDLDLQAGLVRLLGKGDKERLVPIGQQATHWLKHYLTESRPKLLQGKEDPALWISSRGGLLGYQAMQQQLRRLTRKAGLSSSLITAHSLRRACASHMLDHGASPLMLKELLGHERTATLSHYLRQTIADVKATHRRTAPGR
jgi:integrase/recombinase XerD